MSEPSPADLRWLDSAARYAATFAGTVPGGRLAAALVVDDEGIVLGRGVSGAHDAEVAALAQCSEAAVGATLYATITPDVAPLVAAGIGRAVLGAGDPDEERHRAAVAAMREAGIVVEVAGHRPSALLVEAYAVRQRRGRPFVTLRLAVSSDALIGRRDGRHTPLMAEEANRWAQLQRSLSDAVLVGARTAALDGSLLDDTVGALEGQTFVRVVAIGAKTLPPRMFLEESAARRPTIALVAEGRGFALPQAVEVIAVAGRNGRPDLRRALPALAAYGVSSVLVEGGAALVEATLASEMVDRLFVVETAREIGRAGLPATPLGTLDGRLRAAGLVEVAGETLGPDRLRVLEPAP